MHDWIARIRQFAPTGVLLVGLSMFTQAVEAHDWGLRLRTPYEVYAQNAGSVPLFATTVNDFDQTDLVVKVGSYAGAKTNLQTWKGCNRKLLAGNFGFAHSLTWKSGKWQECTLFPDARPTGLCVGDVKVWFGRAYLNECSTSWSDWKNVGGDQFYRYMLTHEWGHVLGLGHPDCATGSVMEEAKCFTPQSFVNKLLTHDKDDINGMY